MRTTAILLAALALGGCVAENDRGTLGCYLTVEAIADPPPADTAIADEQPPTLDRASWPVLCYEVPYDGTVSHPTYRLFAGYPGEIGRQWGDYPTALSALDLEGKDYWHQQGEAWAAPFWAATELAALPVTGVIAPPWDCRLSPEWDYQRTPRRVMVDLIDD